jgi:hypothetical protein
MTLDDGPLAPPGPATTAMPQTSPTDGAAEGVVADEDRFHREPPSRGAPCRIMVTAGDPTHRQASSSRIISGRAHRIRS